MGKVLEIRNALKEIKCQHISAARLSFSYIATSKAKKHLIPIKCYLKTARVAVITGIACSYMYYKYTRMSTQTTQAVTTKLFYPHYYTPSTKVLTVQLIWLVYATYFVLWPVSYTHLTLPTIYSV